MLVQKVDQGMWKRCQDELAVPTVEGESDSDEELFEDLYAAEEEERAEEQKEQDAAQGNYTRNHPQSWVPQGCS